MTRFTVHGIPGSPYLRAVLLALEEKGCDYRLAALPFGPRPPDYLELQPFGLIPAFEDGEFRLYETQAILRYLDRLFPEPPLVPTDARTEARMNQIIGITDFYVRPRVSGALTFPRLIAPKFGLPVDEAAVAAALPAAEHCVAEVARLIGDQPYMAGAALSLADLMIAPHFAFLPDYAEGAAILARHPNLTAWLDRMAARPSMERTRWERLEETQIAA